MPQMTASWWLIHTCPIILIHITNESRHTWLSHVSHESRLSNVCHEACLTWLTHDDSFIQTPSQWLTVGAMCVCVCVCGCGCVSVPMSHGTHDQIMSYISHDFRVSQDSCLTWWMSLVTHMNESRHAWLSVWHSLIHTCVFRSDSQYQDW